MGHSGQLGYINALCDLIDYRKYQKVTSQVLQNFSVVEMLLRKARKCVSKKMRIQWNSELDTESLENRGHWATLENLQDVLPFHLEHYKTTLESCQENPRSVTSKDLTFATRFICSLSILECQGNQTNDILVSHGRDVSRCQTMLWICWSEEIQNSWQLQFWLVQIRFNFNKGCWSVCQTY